LTSRGDSALLHGLFWDAEFSVFWESKILPPSQFPLPFLPGFREGHPPPLLSERLIFSGKKESSSDFAGSASTPPLLLPRLKSLFSSVYTPSIKACPLFFLWHRAGTFPFPRICFFFTITQTLVFSLKPRISFFLPFPCLRVRFPHRSFGLIPPRPEKTSPPPLSTYG